MGNLFDIDDETKAIIQAGLDDLINELGKECYLIHVGRWTACANCHYDSNAQRSSNRYRTGGPIPFPNGGTCPQCNGKGRITLEISESVTFLCEWNPRNFIYPVKNLDLRVPYGVLQTKGFIKDWPSVEKCDHMVFQVQLSALGKQRYKLLSAPGDRSNIIQNRYFVCLWERML